MKEFNKLDKLNLINESWEEKDISLDEDDIDESCNKELKESDELTFAEAIAESHSHFFNDLGILPTADHILNDLCDNYDICLKADTPEDYNKAISDIQQELNRQGLDYLDPDSYYEDDLNESFNKDEYSEFLTLCKELGLNTVGDVDHFSEEHGNVMDKDLLQALRDAKAEKDKTPVEESLPEKDYAQKCREFYGKCAHLDEGYELKEEDLDEYSLNKTACYMNCDVKDLKEILLNK